MVTIRSSFGRVVAMLGIVSLMLRAPVQTAQAAATGLTATGNQMLQQGQGGLAGSPEGGDTHAPGTPADRFGEVLATGDFNGDGYMDLAIGVPNEDATLVIVDPFDIVPDDLFQGPGAVQIVYGGAAGMTSTNEMFELEAFGLSSGPRDHMGAALAAGDFNGDGYTDLAIGVPDYGAPRGSNIGNNGSGLVAVIYGGPFGLKTWSGAGARTFTQNSPDMAGGSETGDQFGFALAAGDFNGDGFADLAIGVPGEDDDAGAVAVVYGWTSGLQPINGAFGNQLFQEGTAGMLGRKESGDHFGAALVTGDFNRDGLMDLAIGAPDEDDGGGAVAVMYGWWQTGVQPGNGNSEFGNQLFEQNTPGMVGGRESNDHFGASLAAGDFNADGITDLAIGVPGEDQEINVNTTYNNVGAVAIIYGWWDALKPGNGPCGVDGNQLMQLPNIGFSDRDRQFGFALAAGDFNGDHMTDLAIGAPHEGGLGTVLAAYSPGSAGLCTVTFETWSQNSSGVEGGDEKDDAFGAALVAADFNGDGVSDLAIGVPGEDNGAGAVNVLFGHGSDATPPTITPVVTGTLGLNGWYVSDVRVEWQITDPDSTAHVLSGCGTTIISVDTTGTIVTCLAQSAGGIASRFVTIKRDATPPAVTAVPDRQPVGGWYRAPFTVTWQGQDTLSGLMACSNPTSYAGPDTFASLLHGTCTDLAGNVGAGVYAVRYDSVPPTVSCSATPDLLTPPDHRMVPVTVRLNANDNLPTAFTTMLIGVTLSEGNRTADVQGFTIGLPSLSGQLRAERTGDAAFRIYALTYAVTDPAGNRALCSARVSVPQAVVSTVQP